jgi:hypothetical protein
VGEPTEQTVAAQTLEIWWRPKGVSEVGSVVAVRGANGPWAQPCGPMEMHAVRRITGAPMGPVTTEMRNLSSSSSPPFSSP